MAFMSCRLTQNQLSIGQIGNVKSIEINYSTFGILRLEKELNFNHPAIKNDFKSRERMTSENVQLPILYLQHLPFGLAPTY